MSKNIVSYKLPRSRGIWGATALCLFLTSSALAHESAISFYNGSTSDFTLINQASGVFSGFKISDSLAGEAALTRQHLAQSAPPVQSSGSITVLNPAQPTQATPAAGQPQSVEPPSIEQGSAAVAALDPNYAFSATKSADGGIVLDGQIPADPALRYFGAITKGDISGVTVAPGAPENFIPSAEAGMRALMLLPEAQLRFSDGEWMLSGTATDAANRDAARAVIPAAERSSWTIALSLPAAPAPASAAATPVTPVPSSQPSTEPNAQPQSLAPTATAPAKPQPQIPATAPSAPPAPAEVAACTAPLADFSARNAILFRSGAAIIADESAAALDELAMDLSVCPDAVVHIEGHTDGDGDDQLNLALSVSRAEAVVNALIDRGVTAARLYALGYGEAKPIADNETPEGKRLNRRIVVTVTTEHF